MRQPSVAIDREPRANQSFAIASTESNQRDGPIELLLVTDVRLMRDGLVPVLTERNAIKIVGTAATAEEAFAAAQSLAPPLAIVDMSCDQVVEMVRALRAAAPGIAIIGFAASASDAELVDAVEVGIAGFVPRDGSVHVLIEAIESVARGEVVCSPQLVATVFRRLASLSAQHADVPAVQLSARELQVTELIDRGLSNKAIAHVLQIGVATVKNHVHNILEKLQVGRRGEAAAYVRDSMVRRSTANVPREIGEAVHSSVTARDIGGQRASDSHKDTLLDQSA